MPVPLRPSTHGVSASGWPDEGADPSPYPAGLPRFALPVTVVCGPPGAGKTTWAKAHARPDHLVLDLDAIAERLSGHPGHDWPRSWLRAAMCERNRMLRTLTEPSPPWPAAWVICCEPTAPGRLWWHAMGASRIVVLLAPTGVCVRRLMNDRSRSEAGANAAAEAAYRWWARYLPSPVDEAIPC